MKLKVYGGPIHYKGKQCRAIVATTSQKKVVELFKNRKVRISLYEICNYWCETGNEKELKIALAKPNTIFYNDKPFYNKEYMEL